MVEIIIVSFIVISALSYFVYKMYKIFHRPDGKSSCSCDSDDCGNCKMNKG